MASNSFGTVFTITTWGESHGKAVGVVIDGCPAQIPLHVDEINEELAKRAPGRSAYTSPRTEQDRAEILSGVFEGKTTGAPICIIIPNKDADSSKYEPIKELLRPGHANYTYLQKYGIFDWKGGGRASARETACRVAAGAVAKKLLAHFGILTGAYLVQMGTIRAHVDEQDLASIQTSTYESPLFCPDQGASLLMMALVEKAKEEGDSLGGIVRFVATGLPVGLGDPVYEKLEAKLAHAMMSLPASKGFEIGSGFQSAVMHGSEHNDRFIRDKEKVMTETNFAGGTLGGISTGMPLFGHVAFKPTSSIKKPLETLTTSEEKAIFELPEGSRHDPCVAIRAVPVVEAMLSLVLADSLLLQRMAKL
jgi:chorismate synthase